MAVGAGIDLFRNHLVGGFSATHERNKYALIKLSNLDRFHQKEEKHSKLYWNHHLVYNRVQMEKKQKTKKNINHTVFVTNVIGTQVTHILWESKRPSSQLGALSKSLKKKMIIFWKED